MRCNNDFYDMYAIYCKSFTQRNAYLSVLSYMSVCVFSIIAKHITV